MKLPIRIGTRASKLARAQAQMAMEALMRAHKLPETAFEIVAMTTAGDKELHKTLDHWGHKGLFTKELEDALLEKRIDIAVHSMKDMPSELPASLTIGAMLKRADVRDAWVSKKYPSLLNLAPGAVVGTSSARRTAQVLFHQPKAIIVPLRGNVETRLRKLEENVAEATLLACAGLDRLGLQEVIVERLSPDHLLPALAQGAIGIECRKNDSDTLAMLAAIDHTETSRCLTAERTLLHALDGSCKTSIGGLAVLEGDSIWLRGEVLSHDGSERHFDEVKGTDAAAIGKELGDRLRSSAGNALLRRA